MPTWKQLPLVRDTETGLDFYAAIDVDTGRRWRNLGRGESFEPADDVWPAGRWWQLPPIKGLDLPDHSRRVFFEACEPGRDAFSIWVPLLAYCRPFVMLANQFSDELPILFDDGWPFVPASCAGRIDRFNDSVFRPEHVERFEDAVTDFIHTNSELREWIEATARDAQH